MNTGIIDNKLLLKRHGLCGFLRSVRRFADRPALYADGQTLSYRELHDEAQRIARCIISHQRTTDYLIGLLASRSLSAYAGLLGILFSGNAYVALSPKNPVKRHQAILSQTNLDLLIVDAAHLDAAIALLKNIDRPTTVLLKEQASVDAARQACPHHRFISWDEDGALDQQIDLPLINENRTAYVMFTSGSSGEPKGVVISHENLNAYVDNICHLYDLNETDRFSQHPEVSFDLSVHDIFVCFAVGACLCCVPQASMMGPGKFMKDNEITVWTSVPSVILFMHRFGMLKAGAFPALRFSFFCGEALTEAAASYWQSAAVHCRIENLYGPTEGTVAMTRYHYQAARTPQEARQGIVPIGRPFARARVVIIDEHRQPVKEGQIGELCISGPQLAQGYFNDAARTDSAFVLLEGSGNTRWYRTGDLVTQDASGTLHFIGRANEQVKILGHRIELNEIDAILMKYRGVDCAVSFAWPIQQEEVPREIISVVASRHGFDESRLMSFVKDYLPEYMLPRRLVRIDRIPLSTNGKVDRGKILEKLKALA